MNALKNFMKLMTFVYAIGALIFYFLHGFVEELLGVPHAVSLFWVALAVSMMAMLSCISYFSWRAPEVREFYVIHVLSKLTSTLGFLVGFVFYSHLPGYLIGAAVDFSIAAVIVYLVRNHGQNQPAAVSQNPRRPVL